MGCGKCVRPFPALSPSLDPRPSPSAVPSLSPHPGGGRRLPTKASLRPECAPGPAHSTARSWSRARSLPQPVYWDPPRAPPQHPAGLDWPGTPFKNHSRSCCEQDTKYLRLPLTTSQIPAGMASKGLQDLKQQAEGAAQDAGEESARLGAFTGPPAPCQLHTQARGWEAEAEGLGTPKVGRHSGLD